MDEVLTVAELALKLHKTPQAVYKDVARRIWPHTRIGRRIFFRASEIERFLREHEIPAVEPPRPDGLGPDRGRG